MLAAGGFSANRLAVIGTIGDNAGDPSFHCRQQSRNLCDVAAILVCQDVRHDLTRFGIDSQMQLAPPSRLAAVLLGIPLAWTEDLQARAVQHDVNRPVMADSTWLASGEAAAAPAEGRMVGHGDLQPKQSQDRAGEAFDLAQRQMEDEPQCQHHLDGDVGVDRLATPTGSTRGSPPGQRCLVQPEGQITPPPQASFVGRPLHLMERDVIIGTLQATGGNRTRTALMLGLSIRALRNKINLYSAQGIEVPPSTAARTP